MKYAMGKSVLAGVFAIGLVAVLAGASYADDGGCSLARSAGKYSFTDTGTIVGVGQPAAVGGVHAGRGGKPHRWLSNVEPQREYCR